MNRYIIFFLFVLEQIDMITFVNFRPNIVKAVSRDTQLFKYLISEWKFHPNPHAYDKAHLNSLSESELKELEKSCLLEFTVAFKFSNLVYSAFSQVFMDQIFKKMVSAFMGRARILYGEPSVLPKAVKKEWDN